MYLSDRDLTKALNSGQLIVVPRPPKEHIGATSIDLQLDNISEAKIWDIETYQKIRQENGDQPKELRIGKFNFKNFSPRYLISPPQHNPSQSQLVFRRGDEIVVRPGGFLLWQTREIIGKLQKSKYICFIDGKSTRARTGLLVHLTAPTIHANWQGNVTLEIANLGPFEFVLAEGDVIAQITVAQITSCPIQEGSPSSHTLGQRTVTGRPDGLAISAIPTSVTRPLRKRRKSALR